jgi:RNA polymerase sigma-70 factor (ECF subfamily)
VLDSDEALYFRVKEGDMRAFDALYARYETRLFGFLQAQLRNRADAEDVFHEAFMSALRSTTVPFAAGTTPVQGGFRTWLYRVARNAALNRMRSAQRGARAAARLVHAEPAREAGADERIASHELEHALGAAVARLPPALAEVFNLRTSGLSYDEMANVLEIPLGTLKSRMHQMVTHLREDLRPWTAG